MSINNHKISNYSEVLNARYGAPGSDSRRRFDEEAYNFYTGMIIRDARKKVKMTQSDLAEKIDSTKSYVSQIENGNVVPSAGLFFRIIAALGLEVDIKPTPPAVN